MRLPEDEALLRDMLDHARRAVAAVAEKQRSDLKSDFVLAAALERFIEVIGEAATKLSAGTKAKCAADPVARDHRYAKPSGSWLRLGGPRHRLGCRFGDLREVIESLEALLSDSPAAD